MENQIFKDINTDLDLNGPYLSFVTQPSEATSSSGSATWVGLATVSFGVSSPENIGTINYQWYEYVTGEYPYTGTKLTNGSGISAATTSTLTVTNLVSGTDDGREFYLEAQYTPAQADYQTGNPPNEPLNSTKAGLTIAPTINITSQPTTKVVAKNQSTTFTINANLSDGSGRALTYQWYIDGVAETDRTKAVTIDTTTNTPAPFSDTFASDFTHTLPTSATNIETQVVGARGGNGTSDAGGPGGGGQNGRGGIFSLEASEFQGKTLEYRIGSVGDGGTPGTSRGPGGPGGVVTGAGDGGQGGRMGGRGWSGNGGGGGAASYLTVPTIGNIIVAGGGGGGGGGSHRRGSPNTAPAGPGRGLSFDPFPSTVPLSNGQQGEQGNPDGGGGGGAGGGSDGGSGGNQGLDKRYGAQNGNGGGSRYDDPRANLISEFEHNGNGYGSLDYTYVVVTPSTEQRNTTFSGTNSSTLTISSDFEAAQEVYVVVSFTGATNTPVTSDKVTFNVVPGTGNEMINFEIIDQNTATATDVNSANLRSGALEFDVKVGGNAYEDDVISFYPPDKDIEVLIDLYGGRGDEWDAPPNTSYLGGTGGKGGYGRLSMTLKQNQEYVIAGLSTQIGTPFLYEGGTLVAVVGQGGQTGRYNKGGDGGSFNSGGSSGGGGSGAGDGANTAAIGGNGTFGSIMNGFVNTSTVASYGDSIATGTDGGSTITCTKGVYWRQQGKASCDNLGTTKFRTANGTEVSNTASITRGYKAGYNIIQTAGAADPNSQVGGFTMSGKGGTGANGGDGATNGAGGGGGSGYISPVATVVSEQSGENDDYAKVVIRLKT